MKKPEESDLVRLVKELERKRQEKAKLTKELEQIDSDAQKVVEYYQSEVSKLKGRKEAIDRGMRVIDTTLVNILELLKASLE